MEEISPEYDVVVLGTGIKIESYFVAGAFTYKFSQASQSVYFPGKFQ